MPQNLGLGFVCAAISTVGFGSNFVPVKKYEMGDGMFFQLTQALGIFTVGIFVQLIRGYHSIFRPWAMLGGFLWCTGNCMCTTIIKCIGMALGLLIWGACNMITGWCMGEWGLFWVKKSDPPAYPSMNIVGAITALVATSIYFFVKPVENVGNGEINKKASGGWRPLPDEAYTSNPSYLKGVPPQHKSRQVAQEEGLKKAPHESHEVHLKVVNDIQDVYVRYDEQSTQIMEGTSWVDNLTPSGRRTAGVGMSVVAGILFGSNFAPPTHLIDDQTSVDRNGLHFSPNGIDYVFSHFTGIILTSLFWFLAYCILMNNRPQVNNQVILPGWLSGVLWGISQASWFVANDNLGLTTAYPIITTGPGLVASLWGVCIFGEVTGKRNLTVLMIAFFVSCVAVALITLSKTL